MSSANRYVWEETTDEGRSFTNIRNRSGPSVLPRNTRDNWKKVRCTVIEKNIMMSVREVTFHPQTCYTKNPTVWPVTHCERHYQKLS